MSTQIHDVLFPFSVALGARGGPERRTEIVTLGSGREERNTPWAHSRRRWNAAPGIRTLADIAAVTAFFEARRGQLYGFRFRDPVDHASGDPVSPGDQPLGTGDGTRTVFQLIKRYQDAGSAYDRIISRPVVGSVRVAANGVELTAGTDFTVDTETGEIIFPDAPETGTALTAGFRFDVPVRFDTDFLDISLEAFEAGEIADLPILEIRV